MNGDIKLLRIFVFPAEADTSLVPRRGEMMEHSGINLVGRRSFLEVENAVRIILSY
jgi:hypothetical protein